MGFASEPAIHSRAACRINHSFSVKFGFNFGFGKSDERGLYEL
jgi:hypothetical protein